MRQFGTKVLPGIFMGYALNAERSFAGDLLVTGAEDLKTMSPSGIHVKRVKSKEVNIQKETINFGSHAGRAKSCKKDSLYPPLCTKRRATSGNNLNTLLQKKKKPPEIQAQILKLHKISEVLWEITYIGIMLLQGRSSLFRYTIFDTSELHRCSETQQNKRCCISRGDIDDCWKKRWSQVKVTV